MNSFRLAPLLFVAFASSALSQNSQRGATTQIRGNTEINVSTKNMTAVAVGENNVVKNRVGVVQGAKQGDTKISASVGNVTNVVGGRNRKSCVNIGSVVSDECK